MKRYGRPPSLPGTKNFGSTIKSPVSPGQLLFQRRLDVWELVNSSLRILHPYTREAQRARELIAYPQKLPVRSVTGNKYDLRLDGHQTFGKHFLVLNIGVTNAGRREIPLRTLAQVVLLERLDLSCLSDRQQLALFRGESRTCPQSIPSCYEHFFITLDGFDSSILHSHFDILPTRLVKDASRESLSWVAALLPPWGARRLSG